MVCDLCSLEWAATEIVAPECGLYPKRAILIPRDEDARRFRVSPMKLPLGIFGYCVDPAFDQYAYAINVGDIPELVEEYS